MADNPFLKSPQFGGVPQPSDTPAEKVSEAGISASDNPFLQSKQFGGAGFDVPQAAPTRNEYFAEDVNTAFKSGWGGVKSGTAWLGSKVGLDTSGLAASGAATQDEAQREFSADALRIREQGVTEGSLLDRSKAAVLGASESTPGFLSALPVTAAAVWLAPEAMVTALGARALPVLASRAPALLRLAGITTENAASSAAATALGRQIVGTLAGSATEGVQAAGDMGSGLQRQVVEQIDSNPQAFANSELGKTLLEENGGDFEAARDQAANKIANKYALISGFSTSLLALPGSAFEARLLSGMSKAGILKEAGIGAAAEFTQEFPQSGADALVNNAAMRAAGSNVPLTKDVWKQAMTGGVSSILLGGLGGAAGGTVSKIRGERDLRDGPEIIDLRRRTPDPTQAQIPGPLDTPPGNPPETQYNAEGKPFVGTGRSGLEPTERLTPATSDRQLEDRSSNFVVTPDGTTVPRAVFTYPPQTGTPTDAYVTTSGTATSDRTAAREASRLEGERVRTGSMDEQRAGAPYPAGLADQIDQQNAGDEAGRLANRGLTPQQAGTLRTKIGQIQQQSRDLSIELMDVEEAISSIEAQLPNLTGKQKKQAEQQLTAARSRVNEISGQISALGSRAYAFDQILRGSAPVSRFKPEIPTTTMDQSVEVDGAPNPLAGTEFPEQTQQTNANSNSSSASVSARQPVQSTTAQMNAPIEGEVLPANAPRQTQTTHKDIAAVIDQRPEGWTTDQLANELGVANNDPEFGVALDELVNEGIYEEAPGKGRATIIRRAQPQQTTARLREPADSRASAGRQQAEQPALRGPISRKAMTYQYEEPSGRKSNLQRPLEQTRDNAAHASLVAQGNRQLTPEERGALNDALNELEARGVPAEVINNIKGWYVFEATNPDYADFYGIYDPAHGTLRLVDELLTREGRNQLLQTLSHELGHELDRFGDSQSIPLRSYLSRDARETILAYRERSMAGSDFEIREGAIRFAELEDGSFVAEIDDTKASPAVVEAFRLLIAASEGRKGFAPGIIFRYPFYQILENIRDQFLNNQRLGKEGYNAYTEQLLTLQTEIFTQAYAVSITNPKWFATHMPATAGIVARYKSLYNQNRANEATTQTAQGPRPADRSGGPVQAQVRGRGPAESVRADVRQPAADDQQADAGAAGEPADPGLAKRGLDTEVVGSRGSTVSIRSGRESVEKYGLNKTKKNLTRSVAIALERRQREIAGKVGRNDRSEEAEKRIARWMGEEIRFELSPERRENNGVGWYSTKFQRALDLLTERYPSLKTQEGREVFTAVLAVTSDGEKVFSNFRLADEIFQIYEQTGRMPETPPGSTRQSSVAKNIRLIQSLIDEYGVEGMREYLLQEKTVGELKRIAKETGRKFNTQYQVETIMPMAAVGFGPKLGAFYANLMGSHGYLTMDRWWSRTFNRYRGNLLPSVSATNLKAFKEMLGDPNMSDQDALVRAGQFRESYEDKGFKNGTPLEKKGNTLYKQAYENINDSPFNSSDRTFMIRVVERVRRNIAATGEDLSVADIQAILWYYEKRLYGELGAKQSKDISYEEAVRQLLAQPDGVAGRRNGKVDRGDGAGRQAGTDQGGRRRSRAQGGRLESDEAVAAIRQAAPFDQAGLPRAFRRADPENAGRAGVTAVWSPSPEVKDILDRAGAYSGNLLEIKDPQEFHDLVAAAKKENEYGAAVTLKEVDDYRNTRNFVTENDGAGFALQDGDIVSVFSTKRTPRASISMLQLALQEGGNRLDAYDTILPKLYSAHGMQVTSRTPWNDQFKPDDWSYEKFAQFNNGRPDIVFMAYTGADLLYVKGEGRMFPSYEEAQSEQMRRLPKAQPQGGANRPIVSKTNTKRINRLLGPQLYNIRNTGEVAVKEVYQNAFDAVREAIQSGEISRGNIDINVNPAERTLEMLDNGKGMSRDTVADAFFTIAGTEKGTGASGGFGIAKAAFLYPNESLYLETTRDGYTTVVQTSGEKIEESADGGAPLDAVTTYTGKPNGTLIRIKFKEMLDTGTDEGSVPVELPKFAPDSVQLSPLFQPIEVRWNGTLRWDVGSEFKPADWSRLTEVKFRWGTATVYVSAGEGYGRLNYLSSGLFQFRERLQKNPMEFFGDPVPKDFYIDIRPSVKPDDAGYPFALNRQSFSSSALEDMRSLTAYLRAVYRESETASVADLYGSFTYGEDLTTVKLTTPKDPSEIEGLSAGAGDQLSIVDGKLSVNGRQVTVLTPDELKARKASSADQFKASAGDIDSSKTIVHDATTYADEVTSSTQHLINIYGSARMKQLFSELGGMFRELRQGVSKWIPDATNFKNTGYAVPVGLSFAPVRNFAGGRNENYYGVTVTVPHTMSLFNPMSVRGNLPRTKARGAYMTMIHELTHIAHMNHGTEFAYLHDTILSEINDNMDVDSWLDRFANHLQKFNDIYTKMSEMGNDESGIKYSAKSLQKSNQQADAGADGRSADGRGDAAAPVEAGRPAGGADRRAGERPAPAEQGINAERSRAAPQGQRGRELTSYNTYFSAVHAAIVSAPDKPMPPGRWRALIEKSPNVKKKELDWLGLNEWLAKQTQPIPKQAVLDYFDANRIVVDEYVGESGVDSRESFRFDPQYNWEGTVLTGPRRNYGEITLNLYVPSKDSVGAQADLKTLARGIGDIYIDRMVRDGLSEENAATFNRAINRMIDEGKYETVADLIHNQDERDRYRRLIREARDMARTRKDGESLYESPHYEDTPAYRNNLGWFRFTVRDIDGKQTLFVEEIQSDWNQAGREGGFVVKGNPIKSAEQLGKYGFSLRPASSASGYEGMVRLDRNSEFGRVLKGYYDTVEEAIASANEDLKENGIAENPFMETGDWTKLIAKRILAYAAEKGIDRIAWTSGQQQATRNAKVWYNLGQLEVTGSTFERTDMLNPPPAERSWTVTAYDTEGKKIVEDVTYVDNEANRKAIKKAFNKEIYEKITAVKPGETMMMDAGGQRIGDVGYFAFYDQTIRDVFEKLTGQKSKPAKVTTADEGQELALVRKSPAGLPDDEIRIIDLQDRPGAGRLRLLDKNDRPVSQFHYGNGDPPRSELIETIKYWHDDYSFRTVRSAEKQEDILTIDLPQQKVDELKSAPMPLFQGGRLSDTYDRQAASRPFQTAQDLRDMGWRGVAKSVVQKLQDKYLPLKEAEQAIAARRGWSRVPDWQSAYMHETLMHGKAEEDTREIETTYLEPMFKIMRDNKISLGEAGEYLYAKHAPERNAYIAEINPDMPDGGSGLTDAQAADIVSAFRREGKLAALEEVAKIYQQMMAASRRRLMDFDLEDPFIVGSWLARYDNYVPLKGWAEGEDEPARLRTGAGLTMSGREAFRALGRNDEANNPFVQGVQDAFEKVYRARKNEVAKKFLNLVRANPDETVWEIVDERHPQYERYFNESRRQVEWRKKNMVAQRLAGEGVFSVKLMGKTVYVDVKDQRLKDSLLNSNEAQLDASMQGIINTLGRLNTFLSGMNTRWNPVWTLTNAPRDFTAGMLNLVAEQDLDDGLIKGKAIVKDVSTDIFKGRPHRALYRKLMGKAGASVEERAWDDFTREFFEDGGATGWVRFRTLDEQARHLNATMYSQKLPGLHQARRVRDGLEHFNDIIENGVRLSTYVNARKAGVSRAKSALLAKQVTINFNRRGEMSTVMNSLYMFFNASVQGTAQFARTMQSKKARKLVYGLAGLGAASALLMMAGMDDDEWEKIPEHVKERNLLIPLGNGRLFKIPLPYQYSIFSYAAMKATEAMMGKRSAVEAAVSSTMKAMGDTFPVRLPEGDGPTDWRRLRGVFGTAASPFLDLGFNRNFFGEPIYRERMPGESDPNSQLGLRATGEGWKNAAQTINRLTGGTDNVSGFIDPQPEMLKYVVEFALGGAARTLFVGTKEYEDTDSLVGAVTKPFINTVLFKPTALQNARVYYDNILELKQRRAEWESLGGQEKAEYFQRYRPEIQLANKAKSVETRLRSLQRQRRLIEESNQPEDTIDARVDEIENRMAEIYDQFATDYNEATRAR